MKRNFFKFILGILLTIGILILPSRVSADSINYQCLKYGTSQQSIASGYYVKPAQITTNGDQYLVTMTIQTGAKLGDWPVTVLSINGSGPANVSKTKNGDNYDYTYSFQTNNLNRIINSSISINVPNVYTAKHDISFNFDTSNLPSLTKTSNNADSQNANSTSNNSESATSDSPSTKKNQTKTKTTNHNQQQNKQIAALNKKNKQTQTAIIVGGIAVIVILSVAAYFFIKRK
ncbi:NEAT domain-containing protein [Paucilactobacillus kaifaensis]|uniref:NEAT domain-containing protein n=1 Tax=Paucilactobacillus kaifaensis TaxID=2559921 RepID=UPI0010F89E6C|nr:NEAT domain-containing protein [Paucilactobacillus kaifaensis]